MIKRVRNLVVKTDPKLNKEWRRKLASILKVIKIPAFSSFVVDGYATEFIDGVDLQEDTPFNFRHDIVRAYPLNDLQRKRVIQIFKDVVFAGIETGYTLADFTKRNIIMQGSKPYLIDYDVIIEEFNDDYIRIFQTMIDYLKLDYKFTGDLNELYEHLG